MFKVLSSNQDLILNKYKNEIILWGVRGLRRRMNRTSYTNSFVKRIQPEKQVYREEDGEGE